MNFPEIQSQINNSVLISNFLSSENEDDVTREIYQGLKARQKYISSRFFYDDRGSSLFEEITQLPEYYPSRTEKSILKNNAEKIMGDFEDVDIIELGSGDCSKISILLDAIPQHKIHSVLYVPVDVSEAAILKSADMLSLKYKALAIHGMLANFLKHIQRFPGKNNRLICFFGSTIGNLTHEQAIGFLLNIRRLLRPGDKLLLGFDMVKDVDVITRAYNDQQGTTSLFNKNILNVLNDISETNFAEKDFSHLAFYNQDRNRLEMHLKATKDVRVTSQHFSTDITIKKGETIHTENSQKYTPEDIFLLGARTGLKIQNIYNDKRNFFSEVILEPI